ncbi:NYN domain-containing protein [Vibrio genomosp. F6]|uniref:Maebl n=1 Tax=Vibrio genomosp. F6 TaxID=723172 RepID=A0A0H3ZZT2_9VIBR|nr:NYN domain-containing protein [Vibrio genomosp. F6]AKN38991.1 Maebl [Vibrio genomosp. F6]TKF14629.1 NYN domain-containing protein [Vibrio genomosp. F6]
MTAFTFAVLVDGENVQQSKYPDILSEIGRKGVIALKWVYADWTNPSHKNWQQYILDTASTPKQQFHHGKDAADHALIMDAIELICTNEKINALCIVSSDGGFSGLAQRIREKGLHTMAIGKKSTPERFRNACHDFVYLENLSQEDTDDDNEKEQKITDSSTELDGLLLKAYWQLNNNEDFVYLGDLGTKLKQIDSTFDTRSYGYSSLKKAIKNLSNQFEIFGEKEDRCYVRPTSLTGSVKARPQSNKNFAFLVHNNEDFHFKKTDLNDSKLWGKLSKGMTLKFQVSSNTTGKARSACNVELA